MCEALISKKKLPMCWTLTLKTLKTSLSYCWYLSSMEMLFWHFNCSDGYGPGPFSVSSECSYDILAAISQPHWFLSNNSVVPEFKASSLKQNMHMWQRDACSKKKGKVSKRWHGDALRNGAERSQLSKGERSLKVTHWRHIEKIHCDDFFFIMYLLPNSGSHLTIQVIVRIICGLSRQHQ